MDRFPFSAAYGSGQSIAVTNSNASTPVSVGSKWAKVTNVGTNPIYFSFTETAGTASASSDIILSGAYTIVKVPLNAKFLNNITTTGTATLHVVFGEVN